MMIASGPKIKGVIFDFDGTLVRSTIDFESMRRAVLDVICSYDIPKGMIGPDMSSTTSIVVAWKYLSSVLEDDELLRFEKKVEKASIDVELRDVEKTCEVPGTSKALIGLRENGYLTSILTRGSRDYVERALKISNIPFDPIDMVCRDDHRIMEAKPNPISLTRAADLIGLKVSDCVYVGDHAIDYECARAASVPFIGVLSGHNDRDRWSGMDVPYIVENVSEVALVLERMNNS